MLRPPSEGSERGSSSGHRPGPSRRVVSLVVGAAERNWLANATGNAPLLRASDLVYLGVDAARETTDWEREQVAELGLTLVDQAALCDDPRSTARRARSALITDPFVVHLDVDVLDFLDAPIAENVNGRNSGPDLCIAASSAPAFSDEETCSVIAMR
jgi:arginase